MSTDNYVAGTCINRTQSIENLCTPSCDLPGFVFLFSLAFSFRRTFLFRLRSILRGKRLLAFFRSNGRIVARCHSGKGRWSGLSPNAPPHRPAWPRMPSEPPEIRSGPMCAPPHRYIFGCGTCWGVWGEHRRALRPLLIPRGRQTHTAGRSVGRDAASPRTASLVFIEFRGSQSGFRTRRVYPGTCSSVYIKDARRRKRRREMLLWKLIAAQECHLVTLNFILFTPFLSNFPRFS